MQEKFKIRTITAAVLGALLVNSSVSVGNEKETAKIDPIIAVEPILREMALTQAELPVLLILANQSQHSVAKEIRAKYEPLLESYSAQIRALYAPFRSKMALETADEEQAFDKAMAAQLPLDIKNRVDVLNKEREVVSREMKQSIATSTTTVIGESQRKAESLVEELGGKVTERVGVVNALAAVVPSGVLDKLLSTQIIREILYNQPGKPELDNHAASLGVSAFWSAGMDGGVWDVGVLDSGVDETHPAISEHTFYENHAVNGSHGTGVACMYGSTNATHKGLAFGLNAIIVDDAGDTGTSMAGADWMVRTAGDDPEVINYSWGNGGAGASDWSGMAKFVDALVYDYNTPWAKSAGNSGFGTTTLTIPGDNYNGMTVANVDDKNTVSRSDDTIRSSSSRGPTLNGRKKPDLAAPGHNTWTCTPGGGWGNLGGTSSAAPKVGAATLLLTDAGHWDPKTIKAVLVNSADAWEDNNTETDADDAQVSGKEWNKTYGWGYIDLWHANFHRDDYFTGSVKPRGQTGSYKLYKGHAFAGDKATLVWEREVDYNNAATPTGYRSLSDLDLRMYRESDNATLSSDTTVADNVHQVAAAASDGVVVKVYAYSTAFDGASSEAFALATEENFSVANGPAFAIAMTAPLSVTRGSVFTVTATVRNSGDVDAHNATISLNLPSGFTRVSGAAMQTLGRIGDGLTSSRVSWQVQAPVFVLFPTNHNLSTTVNSVSYNETFTGRQAKGIAVN